MQLSDGKFEPIFPSNYRRIAVIAPAGPPDAVKLSAGMDALCKEGVEFIQSPAAGACGSASYLAADLEDRVRAFNQAICDERVELILCARGGYGSVHLLEQIDWQTLRQRNLPLIGYSDITALHAGMLAMDAGIPVAGPMVLKMPSAVQDAFSRASLLAALSPDGGKAAPPAPQTAPERLKNDCSDPAVTGKPFAANLTVLCSLCGTRFFPDLTGRILILEDVNEPLYKIDRMLTQLQLGGVFEKISALLFGSFTGIPSTAEEDALLNRAAQFVRGPVWKNFRFGHDLPMTSVNARQTWTLTEGVITQVSGGF